MLALLALVLVQSSEPKLDADHAKLLVYDSARGLTLKVLDDGKVELTLKEEDRATGKKTTRTVSEANAEEFRAKHPDLMKKYELDRYLGGRAKGVTQDEFDEWWKQLKKGMPGLGPVPGLDQPFDEDVQKFLEEQRELFGRLRRPPRQEAPETAPHQAPLPGGREFGVRVDAIGETLRDQLSLKENEGVLVSEVKPGSLAEKSGFKEHDILLTLEGKPITDRWQFRADVLSSLGKAEFEIQLLRAGKRQTVKVRTSARKDE